ncbi:MAG TPA: OB-fold domain-containing protein [Spirochaetota bacterium]|nr:OB-fold domain-containing protein [Spirochaetota bacterium]HQQ50005.1 OB-fold domain-containing protein [Spirochaetota bacterium]
MIGIVSYGGYIPLRRLSRMQVVQQMAWYNSLLYSLMTGERSVANWDEDAITMAVAAAVDALQNVEQKSIDAVYAASTSFPFDDRQNAAVIAEALNCRNNVRTVDMAGSLKAGVSAVVAALDAVESDSANKVMVTAGERRFTRAASTLELMYGDGAAALVVGRENVIAECIGSYSYHEDFVDHYRGADKRFDYQWEERFIRDEGFGRIIPTAIKLFCDNYHTDINEFTSVIYPCPFAREHAGIAKKIKSAHVYTNLHDGVGDTGVAHPLVMLCHALDSAKPGDKILVVGFGQGCEIVAFKVTDAIESFKRPKGITRSIANKKDIPYPKYLKFRELIDADTSIRAEAVPNTSLTALWRHRKMLNGFVGYKCKACGTPQFPPYPICVNPACNKSDAMDDYVFSDKMGTVLMYTGDMLAASVEPPAMYGLVEFDGGGRTLLDFTDCELEKLSVGTKVAMSFRIHRQDSMRGFTGYFWKAVPIME